MGSSDLRPTPEHGAGFGEFVRAASARGELVVQPRMGFGDPELMRRGLLATKRASAVTVGTITLDSFTRTGQHDQVRRHLAEGLALNGYPIAAYDAATTRDLLDGVSDSGFPVQVRHGCSRPHAIFTALIDAGLEATEGGPVSYCLPYGRTPLRESVDNWRRCCALLVQGATRPHLETFGGCMMGQLCPPSLLVALSILEGLFFRQHGVHDLSLSYAQQTHPAQDEAALAALRRLAEELLPDAATHIVLYTYMGVFPRTIGGARLLGTQAARLAVRAGAARLIVKTAAEAYRIPTIIENVAALEEAALAAQVTSYGGEGLQSADGEIYAEARALIEVVLNLDADVGRALLSAFERGYLDVPFCLHPDNAGRARGYIDAAGWLRWSAVGAMPLDGIAEPRRQHLTSTDLLDALCYMQRQFDHQALLSTEDRTASG